LFDVGIRVFFGAFQRFGDDQITVFTGQANGPAANVIDRGNDIFIDVTTEDHFGHFNSGFVGDPEAVNKTAFDF